MKIKNITISLFSFALAAIVLTGCETVNITPDAQENPQGPIIALDETNFDNTIQYGSYLVLFTSTTCRECQELEVLMEISATTKEWGESVRFATVTYQKAPALIAQQNIQELPTLLLYKNGRREMEFRTDYQYAHELTSELESALSD